MSIKKERAYCLSSCLVELLKNKNVYINEQDLVNSHNMLNLSYSNKINSIYTNLEYHIFESIQKIGYELQKKYISNITELDNLIDNGKSILVSIDIKKLKYSNTFKRTITNQNRHFIIILNGKDGKYWIYDTYIPTLIPSEYIGELVLNNEDLSNLNIYILKEIKNLTTLPKDKDLLKLNILNYKKSIRKENPYKLLKYYLVTKEYNESDLFETVVMLSTGGLYASRYLFFLKFLDLNIESKEANKYFHKFKNSMHFLKILIIKYMYSHNENELNKILSEIEKLNNLDIYMLEEIYKSLS